MIVPEFGITDACPLPNERNMLFIALIRDSDTSAQRAESTLCFPAAPRSSGTGDLLRSDHWIAHPHPVLAPGTWGRYVLVDLADALLTAALEKWG